MSAHVHPVGDAAALDLEAALARSPVFSALSAPRLHRLAAAAWRERIGRGRAAYEEGRPADAVFALLSGAVKLVRLSPDGGPATVEIVCAPAILGAEDVLRGERRRSSAVGLGACDLIGVSRSAFLHAVADARAADALLHLFADSLERYAEKTVDLSRGSAESRVAGLLLDLAARAGERAEEGVRIAIRLTRRELAEALGMRSETAFRVTGRLAKAGLIAIRGGSIVLTDAPGLRARRGSPEPSAAERSN